MDVLSLEELKSFKACLQRYKQNATSFINFAEKNKNIKGFEVVNYRELDPMRDFDLIKAIDSYISEKVSADEMTSSVKSYISGSKMEISVKIKAKLS